MTGYPSKLICLAVACLPVASCRDSGPRAEGRTSFDDEAVPTCTFTQVASSPEEVVFSRIEALDVDSQGRIYVGDQLRAEITVLAPDGSVLRTIGRQGEGPGEFRYIRNLQILPGDSVMVYDLALYRMTVFAPGSGEVAYVANLASTGSLTPPNSLEKLPDEKVLFATHRLPFSAGSDDPASDYNRNQVVRLLDWDGKVRRDSVVVVPASQPLVARQGRSVAVTSNPFGRPGALKVGPDGRIYYGEGDSLSIRIYSLDGRLVGGFSLPYTPPPVTSRDIEEASEGMDEVLKKTLREHAPRTWPAFRNFVFDEAGRIWIGLLGAAGQPARWIAFSDSGEPACAATLPPNVDLRLIRGKKAYGISTDELDVPRVVAYDVD